MKSIIAAVAVGFPIAVVLAWAYEITPQGKPAGLDPDGSVTLENWDAALLSGDCEAAECAMRYA